jgi:hypothetical protein
VAVKVAPAARSTWVARFNVASLDLVPTTKNTA